jgi:hypothetical protein
MKKILFVILLTVMFLATSEKGNSQCPPGFSGPYTISIHKTGDCFMQVDYCMSSGITITGFCDIHVTNIRFVGNDCNGLPTLSNGQYWIDWESIVNHIVRDPNNFDCYSWLSLPECPGTTRPIMKVSNGGCYSVNHYWDSELREVKEYIPCDINGIAYCNQDFSLCKEFVNGQWRIKAIKGIKSPQFQCIEWQNSLSLCDDL